jgi:pentatricopeptide repeat protein
MWAKAAEVFDSMVGSGVRPDAVTFSVLVAAYERGGQWRRCLQAFEQMQQQGFRPDACVYNMVSELRAGKQLKAGVLDGHPSSVEVSGACLLLVDGIVLCLAYDCLYLLALQRAL